MTFFGCGSESIVQFSGSSIIKSSFLCLIATVEEISTNNSNAKRTRIGSYFEQGPGSFCMLILFSTVIFRLCERILFRSRFTLIAIAAL